MSSTVPLSPPYESSKKELWIAAWKLTSARRGAVRGYIFDGDQDARGEKLVPMEPTATAATEPASSGNPTTNREATVAAESGRRVPRRARDHDEGKGKGKGKGKSGGKGGGKGRGGGDGHHVPQSTWACGVCTFENHLNRGTCEMCNVGQRPAGVGGKGRQQQQHHHRPQQQLSDFVPSTSPRVDVDSGGSGRSSRRGRDASYLLNFQPLPLPAAAPSEYEAPPPRVRQPSRPAVSTRSKYDQKVQHLRAKYHLLVSPGGDYRAHALDPNYPIEWAHVRAVRLVTAELFRCPICLLEPPTCPQIYQCSHMLCLPCALRLHASATDSGVGCKCPLCSEHVDLDDLRSVCLVAVDPIRPSAPGAQSPHISHLLSFSHLLTRVVSIPLACSSSQQRWWRRARPTRRRAQQRGQQRRAFRQAPPVLVWGWQQRGRHAIRYCTYRRRRAARGAEALRVHRCALLRRSRGGAAGAHCNRVRRGARGGGGARGRRWRARAPCRWKQ